MTQVAYGVIVLVVLLILLWLTVKIVKQWKRGVLLRFGQYKGTRSPGINFIIPFVDRLMKVDTRVETMVVTPQEVITRDNVTVSVDAVGSCRWSMPRLPSPMS